MSRAFPEQRFLRGNFAPLHFECDAPDIVVHGEIPDDLNGTLFRNGPNPLYAPRDRYHMFSGDGMVHAFRIADGRVDYKNRWVRTEKWRNEREAGEALYGTFGNPMTSDPRVVGRPYNLANTNVIWHGGRLLALEEFSPPFELDPSTLESRGAFDFAGKLEGPMTAHPKIDPENGELHFFGYGLGGFGSTQMAYHVADASGQLLRSVAFDAPYAAMVHDFVVTKHHVLFPIFPITLSAERALKGAPPIAWEPEKSAQIGCMPRGGCAEDLRWFEGEACLVFHPMNSYEEGGVLVADMLRYDAAPGFPSVDGSPPDPAKAEAHLERWRFPMDGSTNGYQIERLDDQASEYPRFDERRAGLSYRHGYFATTPSERGRAAIFDQLAHYDFATGKKRVLAFPEGDFVSEPVFVPRGAGAAEGEGYLLAVVFRGAEARSDLIVLDAENIDASPLAIAQLETRVPFGFHGNWANATSVS